MPRTFDRNDRAALSRSPLDDDPCNDRARRPLHARWHDFDDDDPYDPLMDDDEEYEDFRWEEIPDDCQAFPPDELWDEDDWD